MLKPLEQWYCDKCGNIIEKSSDGYVIWRSDKNLKYYDFKIIHQTKCDISAYSASAALQDFLGVNGLVYLTSFLSLGPLKKTSYSNVANNDEFVDFIRRVQIPYYEEARRKFTDPQVLEWHSDSNEVAPYFTEGLKRIIEM